jgi:hypothetical protein
MMMSGQFVDLQLWRQNDEGHVARKQAPQVGHQVPAQGRHQGQARCE